ncbi:Gfo/Idh/MocA family protein [Salibacterium qingdaonense]|uniref:Predicted dehydrogenase n=1 Tax=Salibacterium qingdaonense TaxID=266892 RepID=A0A1I4NIZ9_9BACI|nr:Gfo/Idh/MocA family oxidoreductase [Salibacterium qingdaonense]SFM15330.1 Predicted dehydrogenase [Salibacterium qingdaonense]
MQEKHTSNNYYTGFFKSDHLMDKDKYLFAESRPDYKFNIIGAGMIGQEHIRVTMLEGRAVIHGIYDINAGSVENTKNMFQEEFPGRELLTYSTLQEACRDPEVDGLIICTPNFTHLEVLEEAVKSGKHIMVEKPMATTLEDAARIKKMAESYNGVFQIGLQYRYKAIYSEALHEILERKTIGDVKTISIMEHRVPFLDKVDQWNKFSEYSGGTLVEKCCHYFDLMNLFAESKPAKVYAVGDMDVNFRDFEYEGRRSDIVDDAFVTVVYENGKKASFNLCMFAPMFYEEITICGGQGRLKAYENEDFLPVERPSTHLEVLSGESGTAKIGTPCYPAVIQESGHNGATYYEHKYFIDNIQGRQQSTATADEGFWSIVIGEAAERSIKTGEVVDVKEMLKEV